MVKWWKVKLQYVLGRGVNVAKFHFIADTSSSEPEDRFPAPPSPRATLLARLEYNQCGEQMCVKISSTPLCDDEKPKVTLQFGLQTDRSPFFFSQTRKKNIPRTTNTELAIRVRAFLRWVRVDSGTGIWDRQRDSVHASEMDSRGWCRD